MTRLALRLLPVFALALGAAFSANAAAESTGPDVSTTVEKIAPAGSNDSARWKALRTLLYADREMQISDGIIELDMPYRAHDAATVPVAIHVNADQTSERYVERVTLVIDENPSPIAGRFTFTQAAGNASIETRVRVNAYTDVHAVAEMNTGELYVTSRYVKAAGGCSAPAMKDQLAALKRLGKIKLRQSPALDPARPSIAQLMVSHPNNTGMQMDQVTQHYVPAHFVRNIDVTYGGEPLMSVEGDISLSENPHIRFHFLPRNGAKLEVKVTDTAGKVFSKELEVPAPSS